MTKIKSRPQPFEVWRFAFVFEDMPNKYKYRPVILGSINDSYALIVKITSHKPRESIEGEVTLLDWEKAGLKKPSTARCSKVLLVSLEAFADSKCYGTLSRYDARLVEKELKNLDYIL